MATSTFTFGTITFTHATQAGADALRDAALVDFCKSFGLDIFLPDGITPDQAKVVPAVRNQLLTYARGRVKNWRSEQASKAQLTAPDEF